MLESVGQVDGAVWAQGANFTGDLTTTTSQTWKAAIGGLVRGVAADLGKDGISINAVLPGVVDGGWSITRNV